jgi:hypothetical protein
MFTRSGHKKIVRESFLCAGYDEGKKDSCEVTANLLIPKNSFFSSKMALANDVTQI